MLDELYDENPSSSMDIVGSEINIWDIKTTPLTFAHENFEMNFIGNTCPQKKLNQIWFNELTPALKPFFKFFFLLMLIAFSAFVMTSIDDDLYRRPIARVWEYYIYIWAAGDLFEEINYGMQKINQIVPVIDQFMNYTFDSVMANSAILWRFERYTVIKNYEDKVPSPFNIIIRPIQYINKARKRCKCIRVAELGEIDKGETATRWDMITYITMLHLWCI
ncbi:hypothetical protein FSP39_007361 [Pinctada imbricata]|uniref:Uncharacterized protein n=1 Tax=Pinctada imbricata TaxID=66713 RepID=A0AA88XXP9_PINIB|nr:hypothetical protein FSP39_007361 [Pinctada imbricata]